MMKQLFNDVLNLFIEIIYLCVLLPVLLNFFRSKKSKEKIILDDFIIHIAEPVDTSTPPEQHINHISTVLENPADIEQLEREFQGRKFIIKQFQIAKLGNSEAEYEDRANVSSENDPFLRIAVADGATESLFSDIWAELIVEKFIENGFLETSQLQQLYKSFIKEANNRIENAPEMRRWAMYNKMERGTHTTIAAVEFLNWESFRLTTLGDSCVFYQGEDKSEIEMVPNLSPEDFGNSPQSICHLPDTWEGIKTNWIKQEVSLKGNFKMILCTDALACWLAQCLPKEQTIWNQLFKLDNQESFTNWINDLRSQQVLKNDDVTLVTIDALSIHV